jgi:hypothetical protein
MANAVAEIFPQAEHVFAPRVAAGSRLDFDINNQVSGISYTNNEGGRIATSVNIKTGESNLTEQGYDAVTGKKIIMKITETIDQQDLDFIISSDGDNNDLPRDINGLVVNADTSREKDKLKETQSQADNGTGERAASSQDKESNVGGIDLNPALLNLNSTGEGINFNMPDPQSIQNIRIEGFSPIIFQIIPTNLPLLIGTKTLRPEQQISRIR